MNQLDKFSVNFEIWWNLKILRKDSDKTLKILLYMFAKDGLETINYILTKFEKRPCSCCKGFGFVSEDQPL